VSSPSRSRRGLKGIFRVAKLIATGLERVAACARPMSRVGEHLLIYGATGYTGRLVTSGALDIGLHPILGGRNEESLAAMAGHLGLEHRVASLSDSNCLDSLLRDVRVVLNTAGPFSQTALPIVEACLRTRTHYLDIAGEVAEIEALARKHRDACAQRIMIMPAVGFDVVPSDCLIAHVATRLPEAERLAVGVRGLELVTRGSAKTLFEQAGHTVWVRRHGVLTSVVSGTLERSFDYGDGARPSVNVSWGDVATAYYTTGIPNVEAYFEATPMFRTVLTASRYFGGVFSTAPWQLWLQTYADFLPEGPTQQARDSIQMVIVAEATDRSGRTVCSRLRTPQAYTFTGVTAPAIAHRVLAEDLEVGFQTPARVYGPDFVLSFTGVSREDVK
jgi:short subunit dehydrogenase-like uncharacterized protein